MTERKTKQTKSTEYFINTTIHFGLTTQSAADDDDNNNVNFGECYAAQNAVLRGKGVERIKTKIISINT